MTIMILQMKTDIQSMYRIDGKLFDQRYIHISYRSKSVLWRLVE